jgi:hypothetical protein
MMGRTVCGIRIVGPPEHLQVIIDEFAEHGIQAGRVAVGGDANLLPGPTLQEIRRVCEQRRIPLDFVPELMGLTALKVRAIPSSTQLPIRRRRLSYRPISDGNMRSIL